MRNKHLCLFSDVAESDVFPSRRYELSLREATADPLITISQNWEQKKTKQKPNRSGLNFCPCTKTKKKKKKKRKVNCCPVFLGTLRVITVWPLVITTQSRPSKDALSDFTQQQNPKVVFYSVGFYSDLHAVRTANHFTRVLSRCCYDDCPDKQHESSF